MEEPLHVLHSWNDFLDADSEERLDETLHYFAELSEVLLYMHQYILYVTT